MKIIKTIKQTLPYRTRKSRNSKFSLVGIIILSNLLGGCAIYDQSFDCEAGKGVGCKSISEVNDLINQGNLDKAIDNHKYIDYGDADVSDSPTSSINLSDPPPKDKPLPLFQPDASETGVPETDLSEDAIAVMSDASAPLGPYTQAAGVSRIPEETLRVWIAPFEDKAGDFQGESFIHTVIKPGRWNHRNGSRWNQHVGTNALKTKSLSQSN
ncbi:MAG: type IV conjugative transfer system lipoprotein TraV [Nitrososphaerales archaeon]